MTLSEVAERIGKSKRTVMRWAAKHQHGFPAPMVHAGKLIIFRDRQIERWCRRQRNGK